MSQFCKFVLSLPILLSAIFCEAQPPSESFLPPPQEKTSSPTLSRGGETLPLRPEMLPEEQLKFEIPSVEESRLPSGIHFYYFPSKDLPRVQVTVLMNAGSQIEPSEKTGLAELTARTLRAGGANGRSGDDIDRELEQIGSDFSFSVTREYASGRLFALTEHREKAMQIMADLLLRPDFEPQKLQQQRDLMIEALRRQNDEPPEISRREFRKIIYGADHPLARTPTPSQLKTLTREDVRTFYDDYYRPASLWIGVAGDISRDDARQLVENAFSRWNKPPAQIGDLEPVADDRDSTGAVYYIRKMTAQSQIRLGHVGIPRHSPEQYAVTVLNGIYGTGGFSSRLMNRVRTKRGFVYGVGGGIFSDVPTGLFVASAASKSRTTGAAIEEILSVTRELLSGEITAEEIETAKRDTIFSFMTEFDEPAEVLNKHMLYDFQGYPEDFLQNFIERIRAVKPEEIRAAAEKYIHPDRLKILVVGFDKQFDKPLSTFGPVTEMPLNDAGADDGPAPEIP